MIFADADQVLKLLWVMLVIVVAATVFGIIALVRSFSGSSSEVREVSEGGWGRRKYLIVGLLFLSPLIIVLVLPAIIRFLSR